MGRGAVLDDPAERIYRNSADTVGGCQKLQAQAAQLLEHKLNNAGANLNCSVKTLTGREFHVDPVQLNTLIAISSFAFGAFAAKEKRTISALGKLSCLDGKSALPALTVVDAAKASSCRNLHKVADFSALQEKDRLDSMETTFSHGISTIENWRGQKWLHQDGYARVPMHKIGADWWREGNLTWVKTSHYLETRNDDRSFFRTYKNGGIQMRFGNGYEFYEGVFPERRKIILSTGETDCRARLQGILSAEPSDSESSMKKTGR